MHGVQRMAMLSVTGLFSALIVFDMNLTSDSETIGRRGIDQHYDFIIGGWRFYNMYCT